MKREELIEKIQKIHDLAKSSSHDPNSEHYVWRVLGTIEGIASYIIDSEKLRSEYEDAKRNSKND